MSSSSAVGIVSDVKPPLLFIHKGNSDYLFYTLTCAKLFNPEREIILLGDDANKHLGRVGFTHVPFSQFDDDPLLAQFNSVFQCIASPEWKGREWLQFVFQRWFYLHAFIEKRQISSFWTFDSDTILLSDLSIHEHKFQQFDCTTQCNDHCMNGWVGSREVVERYLLKTIEVFKRTPFLEKEKEKASRSVIQHFNEMRTFDIFREEEGIRTIRTATIIENSAFDECICLADGMETNEHGTKNLYLNPSSGKVLEKKAGSDDFVLINGVNMSWVDSIFMAQLTNFALQYYAPDRAPNGDLVLMQIPRKPG